MLRLLGALAILALLIGGIGFYRGWFSVSGKTGGEGSNTLSLGVTVDGNKAKEDVEKVKDEVSEIGH